MQYNQLLRQKSRLVTALSFGLLFAWLFYSQLFPPEGDGAFGTVYEGRVQREKVAIKVIDKKPDQETILNEIRTLKLISSEYVVRFVGYSFSGPKLLLATEYMEGIFQGLNLLY